jgi:aspartyl/glutamyl-tRNA(Asn/Gln) amidotransferase C subunit
MNKEEFKKISEISGFQFDNDEIDKLSDEFNSIITHIGNIDNVSTDDMEPQYHLNEEQYLRDDIPEPEEETDSDLLENSPSKKGDYVKFKK